MRQFTAFLLIGSAVVAAGIPTVVVAAPADAAVRPQTTVTPTVQSSSTGSTSLNPAMPSVAATTANDKNSKNCGNGNNNQTGNGQNNGNC